MRCLACNKVLSDFEATRKFVGSGNYVELCNKDFDSIRGQVKVVERQDLTKIDLDDDLESN